MRILLVQPPLNPNIIGAGTMYLLEPLALESIAASIPEEHTVEILDLRLENTLNQKIAAFAPHIIGITALTPDVYTVNGIFESIKKQNKNILTVVGGQHASIIPNDFNREYIDVIVIGEGQDSFKELIDAYKESRDFSEIRGLALPKKDKLFFTDKREPVANLDLLPFPARNLIKKYHGKYFRAGWKPVTSIITSRGCPFRCNFCSVWKREDGKYRTRSAENVVNELLTIEDKFISVGDDNFLHDVKRAEEIYRLIKEKGINKTFKLIARSDTIVKHPDLIEKWKEIGTEMVLIGIESFNDEGLKRLNKHNSVKNNEDAIEILHKNGITVVAQFIINPDFTEDDFKQMGDYVEKLDLSHPMFSVLTPLPGTELFEKRYEDFVTYNYDLFDYAHSILPTKINREKFYEHLADLFLRTYTSKNTRENIAHVPKSIYDSIYISIRGAYKY
ncbi:MAG: hypothetical protein A3J83_00740 [Elusimicrobia bacterium RIFOXYA2_FULL_40_6]|nr:MAG: hypothetical protein A3J83_00740 [Elusimicrobia bacterium RIFOXYA2_FULL_40_6]